MRDKGKARCDLDHIDEIANAPVSGGTDGGGLELVEQAAKAPGGLAALIERYAFAPNPLVPRAVSFVLAQRSAAPTTETWGLTRELVARLRHCDDAPTLVNCLTAIQRHLIFGTDFGRLLTPAPELSDFIMQCLDHSPLVRSAAIDLLVRLDEDRLLPRFFSPEHVTMLRRRLTLGAVGDGIGSREDVADLLLSLDRSGAPAG